MNQINAVIVGIYAPNNNQVPFGNKIYLHLHAAGNVEMILILGDFNTVIDIRMDMSTYEYKIMSTSGLPIQFHKYMKDLRFIDVWRKKIRCERIILIIQHAIRHIQE